MSCDNCALSFCLVLCGGPVVRNKHLVVSLRITPQTILLVASILLVATYLLLFVRSHVRGVRREAVRVAGLLSHVPQDVDVMYHVRCVLKAHGGGGHRKAPAAA